MLALPFNFFGLFAIWPLAAGAAGAVGTYTSQRCMATKLWQSSVKILSLL